VSIDRRLPISDNSGAAPCIPPVLLGRLLDTAATKRPPLPVRIRKALAVFRRRIAMMSLPPDEAVVAAMLLVGLFMAVWWVIEYLR